jgi:hypothetical protein
MPTQAKQGLVQDPVRNPGSSLIQTRQTSRGFVASTPAFAAAGLPATLTYRKVDQALSDETQAFEQLASRLQ